MPDGSPYDPGYRSLSQRVDAIMVESRHIRAALAWVQHVRPRRAFGVPADSAGLALHFLLFAREPFYWERLCVLWPALDLGRSD